MFKFISKEIRKSTLFEKLLLIVGIAIGIIGFWLINSVYSQNPVVSWQLVTAIFLWLLLVFMVVLTASNEGIKEELSINIKEHTEETKLIKEEISLLKEETKLVREEIKLLNKALVKKGKK